jgi:hypothetical protein
VAPGSVWTGAEYLARTGIQSADRPARSESMYRLSFPGPPLSSPLPTKILDAYLNRKRTTFLCLRSQTRVVGPKSVLLVYQQP